MANTEVGSAYVSIIPSMKGFQKGIGDTISKLGKTAAVAGAAMAAGAAVAGKAALKAYSDYEQLSGGVAKLFGSGQTLVGFAQESGAAVADVRAQYEALNPAVATVMRNAENGWKTVGMSTNDYMDTANRLSAALIRGLGGDTVAAADRANVALQAISDNANTFGTSIEEVKDVYLSLAKGNYMMLDSLNLGYAGTKKGMEELIADANEWGAANGEASDLTIDSYADVVQAIQQIQEKQGIAGTTAREAATTVEGSLNSLKAAFSNFIAGFGRDDADVGKLVDNLAEAFANAANNVIPRLGQIAVAMGDALVRYGPQLAQRLAETLSSAASEALGAMGVDVSGILDAIDLSGLAASFDGIKDSATQAFQPLIDMMPTASEMAGGLQYAIQSVIDIFQAFIDGVSQYLSSETMSTAVETLTQSVGELQATMQPFIDNVVIPLAGIIGWVVGAIIALVIQLVSAVLGTIASIAGGITGFVGFVSGVPGAIAGFLSTISNTVSSVASFISGIWSALQSATSLAFNAVRNLISNAVNTARSTVQSAVSAIGSFLSFSGLSSKVSGAFSSIKGAIVSKMEEAKNAVRGIVDRIKNFFPLNIGRIFSNLKVPRINVDGGEAPFGIGGMGRRPDISVSWNARGGYVDGATLIGAGEAGGEGIVPLEGRHMYPLADAMAERMGTHDERMIAWLGDNLGRIIYQNAPAMLPREFNRAVRAAM